MRDGYDWRFSTERLASGRWVVRAYRSDAGAVLRYTAGGQWVEEAGADASGTTWRTRAEAEAAFLPYREAVIEADTWAEITAGAPEWAAEPEG
ncbi:MAG: hypothetical protein R3181_00065 [Rubricoccaceae bacterium]|nr:hypothetical protein [Rubricoccaceae bacterium]